MTKHPSAEKRHRQSTKRNVRNQAIRSRVRSAVKKLRTLVEAGDQTAARQEIRVVQSTLDKARTKGVLHRKSAARRVARLSRQVDAMS
jgi:small subunit ribosomal protein S20